MLNLLFSKSVIVAGPMRDEDDIVPFARENT